jgi:regulatory protein SWI6
MSGILQSASMQFTQESRIKQDLIDHTNEQIASLSAQQKQEQQRLDTLRARLRARHDRAKRITNLKRWLDTQRHALAITIGQADLRDKRRIGYADSEGAGLIIRGEELPVELRAAGDHLIRKASDGDSYLSTPMPLDVTSLAQQNPALVARLPPIQTLRHRLEVYIQNNQHLAGRSHLLKEKDGQLEMMYRKVVSLCTKVEEEKIDDVLGNLVQALDSDPLDGVEVGRVREFLRKVEGVEG